MKHDKKRDVLIAIFSACMFVIILFGSINFLIFNKQFYYGEYEKNGVYEKISDNKTYAKLAAADITLNIHKYFRGQEELRYFTEIEKSHMQDVKHLVNLMQWIYYACAIIVIGLFAYLYRQYKNNAYDFIEIISKSLIYSGIAVVSFLILTFVLGVSNFDSFFASFHHIFFPQGNWMFDSSTLLITLFPEKFFIDISIRIFLYALFQSLIFFGIGYWMYRQVAKLKVHGKRFIK